MVFRTLAWLTVLPLQLLLALCFLFSEILHALALGVKAIGKVPPGDPDKPDRSVCSIIMLNWNGKDLLEESLPALRRALKVESEDHEVIVVDNGSTDESVSWLRKNHPWVKVLELGENKGFGEGNNEGVKAAGHPTVVLLNNDMIVEPGFLGPLLTGLSGPSVFAVTSQIFFPEGKRREETGNTAAYWSGGYLHLSHEPIAAAHAARGTLPVLWAGGGSSAFDRKRFLELGGFSSIYSPCYVEDTDLSYRAWRRGWSVLIASNSRVLHKHRSSTRRRFQQHQISQMVEQRKLWYVWRNYSLRKVLRQLLLGPLHLGREIPVGAYGRSLLRLPWLLWFRIQEPARRVSDDTLFRWIDHPLRYLHANRPPPVTSRSLRPKLLIVSAYLPHLGRHGGAGRVYQFMIRAAREFDVSLACFVENDEERAELRQVEPHCQRIEALLRREYRPLSPFPYEPFEEFNCPAFYQKLEQMALETDFDLVHFEWTQMVRYADLFPHCPKLLTEIEVNYAAHQSQVRVERRALRKVKRYYDTLQTLYREIEACRQVDRIICVTDIDRDFLKGYVEPDKLTVVNTGVDTLYFHPSAEPDPDALVYVGAFRHSPNVDAMHYFCSDIFPLILQERPTTHLYIVGAAPPESIMDLGDHPNITVTGFVPDIRDYYALAQVVVVPLRTGVGIRGKILEGWSAGKATVATSLACLGLRASHGENVLISDDPRGFADWTLALLNHPDHCKRLGEAGRRTALQYYEWDQLGEEMNQLYRALLDSSGRQRGGQGGQDV